MLTNKMSLGQEKGRSVILPMKVGKVELKVCLWTTSPAETDDTTIGSNVRHDRFRGLNVNRFSDTHIRVKGVNGALKRQLAKKLIATQSRSL